jgi:hypothetical protein
VRLPPTGEVPPIRPFPAGFEMVGVASKPRPLFSSSWLLTTGPAVGGMISEWRLGPTLASPRCRRGEVPHSDEI